MNSVLKIFKDSANRIDYFKNAKALGLSDIELHNKLIVDYKTSDEPRRSNALAGIMCIFFCAKASISNFVFGIVNTFVYIIYFEINSLSSIFVVPMCEFIYFFIKIIVFDFRYVCIKIYLAVIVVFITNL